MSTASVLAALGRPCDAQALSSCGERGLLLVVAHRPLVAVLLFCGAWMLGPQWLQLSGSSTWAQELWDPGSVALWHTGSSRTEDGTPCPLHWQAALNPRAAGKSSALMLSAFCLYEFDCSRDLMQVDSLVMLVYFCDWLVFT